ncbi:hypothetical protein QBC37DRAFT_289499, partial [Rhypophila decipiens]
YTQFLEFYERVIFFRRLSPEQQERIDSHLRRIHVLRKAVEYDEKDGKIGKLLIDNMSFSMEEWKKSELFAMNIERVRVWRSDRGQPNGESEPRAFPREVNPQWVYDVERDSRCSIVSFPKSGHGEEHGVACIKEINVYEALKKGHNNHLTQARAQGIPNETINYFHVPANNMTWVEKAMSRYYGVDDVDFDAIDREPRPGKLSGAYMLLRSMFWKGQENVGSRHMWPMCENVSTERGAASSSTPDNIALFAPFLHWDTDWSRRLLLEVVTEEEECGKTIEEKRYREHLRRARSDRHHLQDRIDEHDFNPSLDSPEQPKLFKKSVTFSDIVPEVLAPYPKLSRHFQSRIFRRDPLSGRLLAGHKLGQVLIDAARLHGAMVWMRDKSMIRRFLHHDPPLHPRRTLYQAAYTRKSMHWRDDQDSRKVARAVMVDQLWMWVLDGRSLITFFPSRYGVDYRDPSGVHELVKRRLRNLPRGQIRTVYDLALIVLSEVTNVFFDRAKTQDNQPQVLDTFERSIGDIIHQQAISVNRLQVLSGKIASVMSLPSSDQSLTWTIHFARRVAADIKLHNDIDTIIEQLDTMLMIKNQQIEVMTKFAKNAADILDPPGLWHASTNWSYSGEKSKQRKENYLHFKANADAILENIHGHVRQLERLRQRAEDVSARLEKQLALEQQQASAFNDWQNAKRVEKAADQGRAVMMFTSVTIVFLPLSFMTSLFWNEQQHLYTFRRR